MNPIAWAFVERLRVLAMAAVMVLIGSNIAYAGTPLPISGQFDLTSLDGREITTTEFKGKWMVIYFGYASCPDVCPTVLNQIGNALDELGPKADEIVPIFITVDPARDKPEVLKSYLKSFNPRFVGLDGDPDQIEMAAKAFHVYYHPRSLGGGEYTVDHSSYIYALNAEGRFVALLTSDMPGHNMAQALLKLIR